MPSEPATRARSSAERDPRDARVVAVATAVACALPLGALAFTDYLPTNDGPQNAYAAFARAHLAEAPFAGHFRPSQPLTGFGWGALFAALERVAGWRLGYALAIGVAVATWLIGGLALVRALPRARWPLVFGVSAGALQWALYMGFFNWVLGTGLGLCAIGVGLRDDGERPARARHWLALFALTAAATACHAFGAQAAMLVLGLHVALGPRRTLLARMVRLGAVALVPLVVTVLVAFAIDDAVGSAVIVGQHAYRPPLAERLQGFAWFYASGPAWRWAPPLLFAALGLVAAAVTLARRRLARLDRTLLAATLVFAALALILPRHGEVWQNLSPRFVPLAVLFASLLLPFESLPPRARAALTVTLAVVTLLSNGWAAAYHRRVRAASARWLAGLGAGDAPKGTLLPIVMDASMQPGVPRAELELPFLRPHINLGVIYAMDRFAASPTPFAAFPTIHVVASRDDDFPRAPSPHYFQDTFDKVDDPALRHAEAVRLASYGPAYDEVLVIGPEDVIAAFEESGYTPTRRGERLFLGRFEGCARSLEVGGEAPDGPLTIAIGWDPEHRSVLTREGVAPQPWPYRAPLPGTTCGAHWLLVTAPGRFCREADGAGVVHVPSGADLRCTLERRP